MSDDLKVCGVISRFRRRHGNGRLLQSLIISIDDDDVNISNFFKPQKSDGGGGAIKHFSFQQPTFPNIERQCTCTSAMEQERAGRRVREM